MKSSSSTGASCFNLLAGNLPQDVVLVRTESPRPAAAPAALRDTGIQRGNHCLVSARRPRPVRQYRGFDHARKPAGLSCHGIVTFVRQSTSFPAATAGWLLSRNLSIFRSLTLRLCRELARVETDNGPVCRQAIV